MSYYSDYETEPIGGRNPYYRCVHCHRSSPEINGRIEGHERSCLYRICQEAGFDYRQALSEGGFYGPEAEDGPYEDGFRGPRPWNGYDDSEEKAREAEKKQLRSSVDPDSAGALVHGLYLEELKCNQQQTIEFVNGLIRG